jgi:hypothetical protein
MISQNSMSMACSNPAWEATKYFQYLTNKLFIIFKTLRELMLMRSVMSSTSTMFYQLQKVFYFKSRVLSLIK